MFLPIKIKYLAHAAFLFTSSQNTVVLSDPYDVTAYDGAIGYKTIDEHADIITISHTHPDHSYISPQNKNATIFERAGNFNCRGIDIKGIPSFHDICGGDSRGKIVIFVLTIDGIRICHLGDLGHLLTIEQRTAIGDVDILLLPVGGTYTIDSTMGYETMQALVPKICIPIHYKTNKVKFDLSPVDDFLVNCNPNQAKILSDSEIYISKETLPNTTEVWHIAPSKM